MKTDLAARKDAWRRAIAQLLPFADAASDTLPLPRLLRLSLFQVSVGMAMALLTGAINRVMIVELGIGAAVVALMVSLPLVFAPLRALIGHKSDHHRSVLGWRRGPYIWFGSMLQFGGLAILPFALLVLSGDTHGPIIVGEIGAALGFLLVGAGLHTTQTAGLALATDIAPEASRPRVVALLYVMLLAGMLVSALLFGWLLADFTQLKLIKVIQGAALATMVLNMIALWKQEPRNVALTAPDRARPAFAQSWRGFLATGRSQRLLVAVALGAAGFSMQDVLLEPYGGEVLALSVSETTVLTALFAFGTLVGLALAARALAKGMEPHRLAAFGPLVGVFAFSMVLFADPLGSPLLFRIGTVLIGFGGGLFSVGTLTAAMAAAKGADAGLALGAWGAAQATAAGGAILIGGVLRDVVASVAQTGALGPALSTPAAGYGVVYHLEILLLFSTLAAIGPLARSSGAAERVKPKPFGLAAFPG
jgi:BCD family chlorophyll transporter-like MFS transporter